MSWIYFVSKHDVIILDCDGVVFDSNYLKIDAFKRTLSNYDNYLIDEFISYFKRNFGTSRYQLVKYFIENILLIDFNEVLYKAILKIYGENCFLLYEKAEYTEKILEFLTYYKSKKLYIASGSDEKELQTVIKRRALNRYFEYIYGSPRQKRELVEEIINDNKGKSIVLIGDAKSDLFASQECNIDFIFMKKYSTVTIEMLDLAKEFKFKVINHLGDLIE